MRDIQKMCRICLSQGSRDIFESSNIANMLARDDLSRIAEKLRYVTMLKVSRINGKIRGNQGENVNELFWARKIATCGKFSLSLRATFSFVLSHESRQVRCASKFLWIPKENRREKKHFFPFMCAALEHRKKSTIAKMRELSRASDQLGWKKLQFLLCRARVENLCI
jgi:hypothetical protein